VLENKTKKRQIQHFFSISSVCVIRASNELIRVTINYEAGNTGERTTAGFFFMAKRSFLKTTWKNLEKVLDLPSYFRHRRSGPVKAELEMFTIR
jgi:hypothetical protein